MLVRVLGPIEVRSSPDQSWTRPSPQQRAILAMLVADLGQSCRTDLLQEAVWGDPPPPNAPRLLQGLIARLRRILEPRDDRGSRLISVPDAWMLDLDPSDIDAGRFEDLTREGHELADRGLVEEPRGRLEEAIGFWRGHPFGDVGDHQSLIAERTRLEELRLSAIEQLLDLRLRSGEAADVVAEADRLVRDYPLRERSQALLMEALYRTGRQVDALRTFQRAREQLVEEVGAEPGPQLQRLYEMILQHRLEALPSTDLHPNNLPAQLTSFIGREQGILEISKLLSEVRLVTLTGAAGVGKTRLALRVAEELIDRNADGVWLVELASVSDPGLVIGRVAEPFEVRDIETSRGRRLLDVLVDYLSERELLMVLDNCEHVIDSSASLSESLLTRCPRLRILATSRERLGISGEVVYPVPALSVPGVETRELEQSEAVRLFLDRAAQLKPDFRLMPESTSAVRDITRRLDGLPLAIEIVASRSNLLTPGQICQRLDDQFSLITSDRDDQGRHTSLEAAMNWSYDLLNPQERSLFRQLAVFVGGWMLEAAETICESGETEMLDLLGRLVDRSLVEVTEREGSNRYRLLEPVRQYALVKLRSAETEENLVCRRHTEYFLQLAEASEAGLRGHQQELWMRKMDWEHDNLRKAIGWSLDEGYDEWALRIAAAMSWFWWLRGYWNEAQDWFERVYEATPHADPALRNRMVYKLGSIEVRRTRPARVKALLERSLPILRAHGTPLDVAWATVSLAQAQARNTRERERGIELAKESLTLFSAAKHPWCEAYSKMMLGSYMFASDPAQAQAHMDQAIQALVHLGDRYTAGSFSSRLGDYLARAGMYDEGRQIIERGLKMVEGTGARFVVAHCKSRLAKVTTMTGDLEDAKRRFEEALSLHRQIGDEYCTALINMYLGEMVCDQGDFSASREHLAKALNGFLTLENKGAVTAALRRIGWLAARSEQHERAARLLGFSEHLRDSLDAFISTHDQRRMNEVIESLRASVDPQLIDEWWKLGADMKMDRAIEQALET